MNKTLDIICLGRAGVDLYAQQIGSKLEDVHSFAKYLGGSSGNVAFGTARLGLKSAMLTCVGDEQMGHFVKQELADAGVDVSHIQFDNQRLTGLVLLGIKDIDTFPLLFYREQVADMAIDTAFIDEKFIASSKVLAITGTHFSSAHSSEVCRYAIDLAKKNGTKTVLDIDYRPVLWGLTKKGAGENRYVSSATVSTHLQGILPLFDLIVGTEEEFCIAGGFSDITKCLKHIRNMTKATLVVKRGASGCAVFNEDIGDCLDDGLNFGGFDVPVLNVLGAGDAFFSGFLRGWIYSESDEKCCTYANACGALVVSRHGCAPAMPSWQELDYYIQHADEIKQPAQSLYLNRLHKVTTRKKHPPCGANLGVIAFDDQQLFDLAMKIQGNDAQIPRLKRLIFEAVKQVARHPSGDITAGILCDDKYGQNVLNEATGSGLWITRPVEQSGSRPLEFEEGDNVAAHLATWAHEHVVKCQIFYHPDDAIELRLTQERRAKQIYDACIQTEHELLLDIITPENRKINQSVLARTISRFYHLGVYPDWWAIPLQNKVVLDDVTKIIARYDSYCRGIIVSGLAPLEQSLAQSFNDVANFPLVKGFMMDSTVFAQSTKAWLGGMIDDTQLVDEIADSYQRLMGCCWQQSSINNERLLFQESMKNTVGN